MSQLAARNVAKSKDISMIYAIAMVFATLGLLGIVTSCTMLGLIQLVLIVATSVTLMNGRRILLAAQIIGQPKSRPKLNPATPDGQSYCLCEYENTRVF